jgi:hypothetical protein
MKIVATGKDRAEAVCKAVRVGGPVILWTEGDKTGIPVFVTKFRNWIDTRDPPRRRIIQAIGLTEEQKAEAACQPNVSVDEGAKFVAYRFAVGDRVEARRMLTDGSRPAIIIKLNPHRGCPGYDIRWAGTGAGGVTWVMEDQIIERASTEGCGKTDIYGIYPLPWRKSIVRVGKRNRVIVIDANGNEACECAGETSEEREAVADYIAHMANGGSQK